MGIITIALVVAWGALAGLCGTLARWLGAEVYRALTNLVAYGPGLLWTGAALVNGSNLIGLIVILSLCLATFAKSAAVAGPLLMGERRLA